MTIGAVLAFKAVSHQESYFQALMQRTEKTLANTEVIIADGQITAANTEVIMADVQITADRLMDQNELLAKNDDLQTDNKDLRERLIEAVERWARAEARAGRDPLRRLAELRDGNAHDLLDFLDDQIPDREVELVQLHRERIAVAYLVGELDKAEQSVNFIQFFDADDMAALSWIGHIQFARNDLDAAELSYRRMLTLAGQDELVQAVAIGNLGNVLLQKMDIAEAERLYRIVISKADQLGSGLVFYPLAVNLANILRKKGDLNEAENVLREVERILHDALTTNSHPLLKEYMAQTYHGLGLVLRDRHDSPGAEDMFRKALAINKVLGRNLGMVINYSSLYDVFRERHDFLGAEDNGRKALAILEDLSRKEDMANWYLALSRNLFDRNDLKGAEDLLRKALPIFDELGRREKMAAAYSALGMIMLIRRDLDGAESMLLEALAIDDSPEGMASSYVNLGLINTIRGGDHTATREMWEKAKVLLARIGAQDEAKVQDLLDRLPE